MHSTSPLSEVTRKPANRNCKVIHSYFKQVFKTFQENYCYLLYILSRSIKQFLQCISTIKSVIFFTTELKEGLENRNESLRFLSRSPQL